MSTLVAWFWANGRMRALSLALATVAALGFVLSVVAHVAAAMGVLPFGGAVWGLHGGAVFVAIPAALIARAEASSEPLRNFWRATLRRCPPWVKALALATFVYAGANFVLLFARTRGTRATDAVAVQGFSAYWMAFYAIEFAILVAFLMREYDAERQR